VSKRGELAKEARRIVAEYGVSMRQAYRYAAGGREPSACVREGKDGRRYHVWTQEARHDPVDARQIRYTVAAVAKRASLHGITKAHVAEIEEAARCVNELAAAWRACVAADSTDL
jgi:hypothetical protein